MKSGLWMVINRTPRVNVLEPVHDLVAGLPQEHGARRVADRHPWLGATLRLRLARLGFELR
jgi:hypothetical protein